MCILSAQVSRFSLHFTHFLSHRHYVSFAKGQEAADREARGEASPGDPKSSGGSGSAGGGGRPPGTARKGGGGAPDDQLPKATPLLCKLQMSLEDVYNGKNGAVSVWRHLVCAACTDTGVREGARMHECHQCDGT